MNIDSNATTAILSSSEMSNSLSLQNSKNLQSGSSFQEQLKSAANEKDVKSSQEAQNSEKTEETKNSEKTVKQDTQKENSKVKSKETEKSAQNSDTSPQAVAEGEVSVNVNAEYDSFSMLSEQVKNFMLKNGGSYNFNNIDIDLMTVSTRAEIANVPPAVDYTSIQMSDNDALFFSNLVKNTDMSMQSIASEFQKSLSQGNIQQTQSTAKASAALIAALQESAKTHQPFRIDFDKDVSVILRVDKDGSINANFIPGDKAVEAYLRNNIDFLKQRFNEENIAYGELNYSQSRQNKEDKEHNNKKEQENE